MKGQSFRQLYESLGPVGTVQMVSEGLASGELKPEDFSLKELAIGICGEAWYLSLGRNTTGAHPQRALLHEATNEGNPDAWGHWVTNPTDLLEAGEGVDVSAFSAITGQLFFNKINEGWKNADFVGDSLYTNYPTKLDGEKIPWISHIFTQGDTDIHAGLNYPEAVFGPRWITTPRCTKQGHILSLTKEMVFFDRTGQVLRAAQEVGWALRYNKEYRQLNVFLGLVNNYNLNGTAYNTYLTSGSNYVNAQSSTPLVDYTSLNQALYLFSKILDPDTGRPIVVTPKDLFVMPFNMMNAKRILTATSTQTVYPAYSATSVNPPGNVKFEAGNPIPWTLGLFTSPIAYQILVTTGGLTATQANAYWFVGDFKESFYYAENWPFETFQAPAQNIREFENDIVSRFKCSERGTPFVYDPRYTCEFWDT